MDSRTILITGASSGFGKIAAALFVSRGHRVLAGIRGGEERLESIFPTELLASGRLAAVDLHMDDPGSVRSAASATAARFGGKLDVLINNAGYGLLGPLERIEPDKLEHQLRVNFLGPMTLIQSLLPSLREASGRIINVSSTVGTVSLPFYSAYSASKFALEGASEALYYELRPFGVQVALVEPGGFKTEFMKTSMGSIPTETTDFLYGRRIESFNRYLLDKSGTLSGGDPARVARLLVRLAERRRMPIRNYIGLDAQLARLTKWLLPESFRLRLQDLIFKKLLFKE